MFGDLNKRDEIPADGPPIHNHLRLLMCRAHRFEAQLLGTSSLSLAYIYSLSVIYFNGCSF